MQQTTEGSIMFYKKELLRSAITILPLSAIYLTGEIQKLLKAQTGTSAELKEKQREYMERTLRIYGINILRKYVLNNVMQDYCMLVISKYFDKIRH